MALRINFRKTGAVADGLRQLSTVPATQKEQWDARIKKIADDHSIERAAARAARLEAERATRAPLGKSDYIVAASELRDKLMTSKRRVRGSPLLALEHVAVLSPVQRAIEAGLSASGLRPGVLRKRALRGETARAHEAQHRFIANRKLRGNARVLAPPNYESFDSPRSYAAVRAPGTLAACVHVLTELRRKRPQFSPVTALDFGAGIGIASTAAARVFRRPPLALQDTDPSAVHIAASDAEVDAVTDTDSFEENDLNHEAGHSEALEDMATSLKCATLVEKSREMQILGAPIIAADPNVSKGGVQVSWVSGLRNIAKNGERKDAHDLVLSSYTLSEIARSTMASMPPVGESAIRDARARRAEKELKSVVKELWARTAPGGCLVVIEDGTAAGFETIVFVREIVRRANGLVIAPCLHSEKCPLDGNITRHRVCRFVQRLNRPLFLRIAKPTPNGFEDEHFSYIVLQKPDGDTAIDSGKRVDDEAWGRVIRPPMLRGKHVVLDTCTPEGILERRVVTKRNSPPGMYNIARKACLGDVWPVKPSSAPQTVNF